MSARLLVEPPAPRSGILKGTRGRSGTERKQQVPVSRYSLTCNVASIRSDDRGASIWQSVPEQRPRGSSASSELSSLDALRVFHRVESAISSADLQA